MKKKAVAEAFKNNGKSISTYTDGRKKIKFFIKINKKEKIIKIHKIIYYNDIVIKDKKYKYIYWIIKKSILLLVISS